MLLRNETEITKTNFRIIILFKHLHSILFKFGICIFIIISTIILDFCIIEKIFFIFMSLLGIRDALIGNNFNITYPKLLNYEFLDNYFYVYDKKESLKIQYVDIEKIIITKKYYYIVIANTILIVSKCGFTYGTKEELEKLIKTNYITKEKKTNE